MFGALLRSIQRKNPAFDAALVSSPGGRRENEDACGSKIAGGVGCFVLCDGLGGHRGGQVASKAAVEAALASFEANPSVSQETMAAHMERANLAVVECQRRDPEQGQMRTTIVMLVADARRAAWAHSGDSRLYRFRAGRALDRTRDDSVPQRLFDAGEISEEAIRFHEDRGRLLRSLGNKAEAAAAYGSGEIEPGDAFLLASDGFWELVLDAQMEEDLRQASDARAWLARMEQRVRERIVSETEPLAEADNYSAIAVLSGRPA